MANNLFARYYQKTKERLQKIILSMKNKGWLNIEKNILKCGKTFCNNLVIHYFCTVFCPV